MPDTNKNATKIKMWKFYLADIICFLTLGVVVIIGSVVFTAYYYSGAGTDDLIMLFIGVPTGVLIAVFPFVSNYRNMLYIQIDDDKCTSYSLNGKKVCEVDFHEKVYRSYFYVRFQFIPQLKFIAIANEAFVCEQPQQSIFKRKLYGKYPREKVIVFPCEAVRAKKLNWNWERFR